MLAENTIRAQSDFFTVDLSSFIGHSVQIRINTLTAAKPLFWHSYQDAESVRKSRFLESPGLPLAILLGKSLYSLPKEVQARLDATPSVKQFAVLQAMLLSSEAMELALSSPLLFMLLVDEADKQGVDEAFFQHLVRCKRTAILEYLGLPARASLLKILHRSRLQLRYAEDVQAIREVLQTPEKVRLLQHVRQPSLATFLLLSRHTGPTWPGLLSMLSQNCGIKEVLEISRLVRDAYNLGASVSALQKTATRQALHTLHDRFIRRYNQVSVQDRALLLEAQHGSYPTAPVAGSRTIIPVNDWHALLQEGIDMQHCVGSYSGAVAQREVYVYQVTEPERLTLSLKQTAHGWVVDELKGLANAEPEQASINAVQHWLLSNVDKPVSKPPTAAASLLAMDNTLLNEAEKFVALRGHSSISALQHHFKIGYTSAAHLFQLLNLRAGHS